MKRLLACLLLSLGLSQSVFAQAGCGEIQKAFDQINTVYRFGAGSASSWATVQQIFGTPAETKDVSGRVSTFIYAFRGCSIEFEIGTEGKVETKKFRLVAAQSTPSAPMTSVQPLRASATTVNNSNQDEVAQVIKSLDATLQQLKTQISDLERVLRAMPVTQPQAVVVPPATGNAPYTATPIPADIDRLIKTSGSTTEQQVPASPSAPSKAVNPVVAENGSYKGEISDATGRPKDVYVNGYYRKDGTYVRGHYRSAHENKLRTSVCQSQCP